MVLENSHSWVYFVALEGKQPGAWFVLDLEVFCILKCTGQGFWRIAESNVAGLILTHRMPICQSAKYVTCQIVSTTIFTWSRANFLFLNPKYSIGSKYSAWAVKGEGPLWEHYYLNKYPPLLQLQNLIHRAATIISF